MPYFWKTKTHVDLSILCSYIFLIFVNIDQGRGLGNFLRKIHNKTAKWTNTPTCVFLLKKYFNFWSILIGHFIKHKPCIFWRAHQQLLWLVLYYLLFWIMEYYKLYIHFFARALEKTRYYSCSLQVLHKDDKAHQLFLIGYLRNLWQIKK